MTQKNIDEVLTEALEQEASAPLSTMHPLERYKARHANRPGSQTPDEDLLLLSIAEDTHVMRLLAEENQAYIRATMDNMNNDASSKS